MQNSNYVTFDDSFFVKKVKANTEKIDRSALETDNIKIEKIVDRFIDKEGVAIFFNEIGKGK